MSNKTIVLNHPPLEEITITAQNTEIIASPFKTVNPKDTEGCIATLKDYKNLQHHLGTRQIVSPHFLDRNLDKNRPIFKPMEVGNKTLKLSNNNDLIKTLTKRIEQLDLTHKPSTSNTKSINVITEVSPSNVDKIRAIFEEQDPQVNRIIHQFKQQTKTRNYYPRPTLSDLQYEEMNQITQSKYDRGHLYQNTKAYMNGT